jgi:hypothetical protein
VSVRDKFYGFPENAAEDAVKEDVNADATEPKEYNVHYTWSDPPTCLVQRGEWARSG